MTPTRSALLAPLLALALAACTDAPKPEDTDTGCQGADCGNTNGDEDGDGYMSSVDCDDQDPDVHGGAPEVCDDVDNDCDGLVDDDDDGLTDGVLYLDADADGYGSDGVTTSGCDPYDRWVRRGGDCNDTDEAVNPEAAEVCDEQDNDCDDLVDDADDELDGAVYYLDEDGDGFGGDGGTAIACSLPEGYAGNDTDCDDADPDIHPTATDVGDGVDNDCDGETDEDVSSGGGGVSGWSGYFIVGKYETSTWSCLNYFSAEATEVSEEDVCPACDFSLRVEATYEPDALAGVYEECDWGDFEIWDYTTSFESFWSFAYDPRRFDKPVAYYYYGGDWYPFSYMYYGDYGSGEYLQWVAMAEYDSAGLLEASLFWGYIY